MPDLHAIRLNRAWEYRLLAEAAPLDWNLPPAAGRIDLPAIQLPVASHPALLLLTRHFNRPSNLEPAQQVLLSIGPAAMVRALYLNQQPCPLPPGATEALLIALEARLERYNRLDVLVADASALATADVRLVIHEPGERIS